MSTNRYLIVYNPKAGSRSPEQVISNLRQGAAQLNDECELWIWERTEDLDARMADAVNEGYRGIMAVGGDGTAHHVGKWLIGTETALGILPIGSGNALANHLGLGNAIRAAVAQLPELEAVAIDSAEMNGRPFLGFFGIGVDALVAHDFARVEKRSFARYFALALKDYAAYEPEQLEIRLDGERVLTSEPHVLGVMNSAEYGNRAKMAPGASLTDGKLEVFYVNGPPMWQAPEVITRVFTGTLPGATYYHQLKARDITIRRPGPGPAQMDGEPAYTEAEVQIRVRPSSLKLLLPPSDDRRI